MNNKGRADFKANEPTAAQGYISKSKRKKRFRYSVIIISLFLVALIAVFGIFSAERFRRRLDRIQAKPFSSQNLIKYDFLQNQKNEHQSWVDVSLTLENAESASQESDYPTVDGVAYTKDTVSVQYGSKDIFLWKSGDETSLFGKVEIPEKGKYYLVIDYFSCNESYEKNYLDLIVDGEANKETFHNIELPDKFIFETHEYRQNKFGNDIYPQQRMYRAWSRHILREGVSENQISPLILALDKGAHTIEVKKSSGAFWLGKIRLIEAISPPSYKDYLANRNESGQAEDTHAIVLEAENFDYKNQDYITITNNSDVLARPYQSTKIRLNSVNASTYKKPGDRLAYLVEIQNDGFYTIAFKTFMPQNENAPVFVNIEIDGAIPFKEFSGAKLPYVRELTCSAFDETPVFLTSGLHEIAIVLNGEIYANITRQIDEMIGDVNDLGVDIRRLTGNNQDKNREWEIDEYLPNIESDLSAWNEKLFKIESELLEISDAAATEAIQNIRVAKKQLDKLREKPNEIPSKLTIVSQGSSSILQLLSQTKLLLQTQPLGIDQIIIGGTEKDYPITKKNGFYSLSEGIKRFAASFSDQRVQDERPKSIDIWVRRSRQHAEVLNTMIEEMFTEQTGIAVNLSIMTDPSKITMANAAGKQPDGTLGVESFAVFDLALRGALADLRQFDGYQDIVRNISPGTFIQMVIDDSLYGIAENQDFYVMFYRKDIFEQFGLQTPDTWDDVLKMLPVLQRYGMNFYTPLASKDAFKSWPATMPFFSQFGAEIYEPEGMRALVDSNESIQAMKYMTDLFKLYGMPLQVSSFYNDFRMGNIPIGISNFTAYLELTYGAPEIANQWSVLPVPGMDKENGEIERWITGGCWAVSILEASEKKEDVWTFMKWWLSEDVQRQYASRLQNMYGPEYLWNSANLNVMKDLPIPEEHRAVILEQVAWIKEAPKIPGGYFVEREISNAFSRVVYEGMDVRSSMDMAAIIANREIERKMEEFGYRDAKGMVRPYEIPTIDKIKGWCADG